MADQIENPSLDFDAIDEAHRHLVSKIKLEYANLLDHIRLLREEIVLKARRKAEVYEFPVPTRHDIGSEILDTTSMKVHRGQKALDRALTHYGQNQLQQQQIGVMANRLPGVIWLNNVDESDFIERIARINAIKDTIKALVTSIIDGDDDEDAQRRDAAQQFAVMSAAVKYAVRTAIYRHILVIDSHDPVTNFNYSLPNRTSMSKAQPRDYWIEKIERARNKITRVDERSKEEWLEVYKQELYVLSAFPKGAYFRVIRPIRKAPIVNLKFQSGMTKTPIAHSPIILLNHNIEAVKYKPFKKRVASVVSTVNGEPVIHRMHLYKAAVSTKPTAQTETAYTATRMH